MFRMLAPAMPMLLAVFWGTPALAQFSTDRDWWHPAWGWGHMMFGGVMMIVFWGGIILLVVLLVRWAGGSGDVGRFGAHSRHTPLEILKERFAKGEIDKQEYEERRKLLTE